MLDIHDIRPPIQVGWDPGWIKAGVFILVCAAALLLLVFFIRKVLKKKPLDKQTKLLPPPLPPFEAAVKQINVLKAGQIQDVRLFYFDLTMILKTYVGKTFGFPGAEMTSQELVRQINTLDLDREMKKEMSGFSKITDGYKYAGVIPARKQAFDDLSLVEKIICRIQAGIDVKPPAEPSAVDTGEHQLKMSPPDPALKTGFQLDQLHQKEKM